MFRAPTTATSVERFIGALTMALGVGAMIPRSGNGLYAVLQADGSRGTWAMVMLTVGTWMILASYTKRMPVIRVLTLSMGVAFWGALTWKFIGASLWGAALQGGVVIMFGIDTGIRLIYAQAKQNAADKARTNKHEEG